MDPITRQLVETVRQITEGTNNENLGEPIKVLPQNKNKPDVHQTLHVNDGQHYVVSSTENETLVFPSDKHGNITSYTEVHAGSTPNFDDKQFNVRDHHTATFQQFIKSGDGKNTNNQEIQKENFDLMSGLSTIAPAAIAAGALALPVVLPRIMDRIKDAGKPSIIPIKSSVPPGPVGKLGTHKDLDAVNQSNSARQHLEDIEMKTARAEGRRPNPVTDEAVARLVQSRVSAAGGVMTRRENAANPYNLPRPGNDGY